MLIHINGKDTVLEQSISLAEYVAMQGIEASAVVADINGQIIERSTWDNVILNDGDRLELISFVGGG